MGTLISVFERANDETRQEKIERLKKAQKQLRTGSVTRSIQRHLGEAEQEKAGFSNRRTKSLDYPRKPHAERRGSVRLVPNPSMPQDEEAPAVTTQGATRLCKTCSGINIDSVTDGTGYQHLLLSELYESKLYCEVCKAAFTAFELISRERYTADRYRIVVSLETQCRKVDSNRSPSGHYDASSAPWDEDSPSFLRFAIADYRPWEEPDLGPFLYQYTRKRGRAPKKRKLEQTVPMGPDPVIVISEILPVLTNEHDKAAEHGVGWVREIGQDTASDRSFDIAAAWLETCLSCDVAPRQTTWESHDDALFWGPLPEHPPVEAEHAWTSLETAAGTKPDILLAETPSRLIQILPRLEKGSMVRLIETKSIDNQGMPIRFAALSYCWGQPKPGDNGDWRTTKTTLGSHFDGISRRTLPSTLQDGIVVAEKLNIPYIWIDALCIVQDDADDWAREAAKMSGIFLGSVLTIAVASSASGDDGCFNTQSQSIISSARSRREWLTLEGILKDGRRSCLYLSNSIFINNTLDMYQDQVLAGPLATRAWTLQEQVLPRRLLFYTSKQLVWKCTHCLINEENFPQRQHQDLYPILDFDCPLVPEAVEELWYQGVVERYSKRNITVASDKLVAISALAKATYLNRRVDYVAGLWKDCLLSGTLWRRDSPGYKNKTYTCPSWSWASQSSVVSYDWARNRTWGGSMFTPRVVDVDWKPGPASLFGDVISASILLDTRLRVGTLMRDYSLADNAGTDGLSQSLVLSNSDNTKLWHAEAIMDDEGTTGGLVAMAIMSGCQDNKPKFLLLSPPDLDADEYRRIGIARLEVDGIYPEFETEESADSGWKRKIIKLV